MSQPLPSPTPKMSRAMPGHQSRKRKISAPPQLRAHLVGSGTPTPTLAQKKFIFPTTQGEGVPRPSTPSSSTDTNTPKSQRKELYRHNSTDDLFRNYHDENSKVIQQLQMQSNGVNAEEAKGLDNQSFVIFEDPVPTASQNTPAMEGNIAPTSSSIEDNVLPQSSSDGAVTSPQVTERKDSQNVSTAKSGKIFTVERFDSSVSLTSSSPTGHQTTSLAGDSQSVFTDIGTPSTYVANDFFRSSLEQHGSTHAIFINGAMKHNTGNDEMSLQSEYEAPKATDPAQRKKWLVDTLSTNLAIIYILFLVVVGIICYLMDMFAGQYSRISEAFNIYLMTGQISFLAYIHISVRRYINKISRLLKKSDKDEKEINEESGEKQDQHELQLEDLESSIHQHYGFTDSSHGGSLYLKIGAVVFCMGHLVFSGLELASKSVYYMEEDPSFHDCTSLTDIAMSIMLLLFVFYQLFFAFKFSNLIINKRMIISKFGIMHCIGSSLCYWIYMIIQETLASLLKKQMSADYHDSATHSSSYVNGTQMVEVKASGSDSSSGKGTLYMGCENTTQVSNITLAAAPYLYPFSIEFNILMVGFWILLWENQGKIHKHDHLPSIEVTYEEDNSTGLASNLIIYVDCHASSRGLFTGLLMTIISVISIILYFVFSTSEDTLSTALLINSITEIIMLSLMLLTSAVAFYYIRGLDIIKHKISSADDILLYICLPSVFLYAFFIMVPYTINGDYLHLVVNIMRILQSVLQTALIVDGLRRCSNSKHLQNKKPGREVIIFLVVANVASWLLMSFQIISVDANALLYEFYGKEVWTTVSHFTLPLCLFYRFHASVCLADIWKDAFEPDHH